MKPPRKEKHSYDSAASKEKIRRAAIEIFSKKGLKATTVRMIAQRSGVNAALISRYFGSKDKLFISLIQDEIAERTSNELAYPPQANLKEELTAFISSMLTKNETRLKFLRIIVTQALVDTKYKKVVQEKILNVDPRLLVRIQDLQRRGKIGERVDPSTAAMVVSTFLAGACLGSQLLLNRKLSDIESDVNDFVAQFCQCLDVSNEPENE